MPLLTEIARPERPVVDSLKAVVLGVFSILSALTIRELIVEGATSLTPNDVQKKLVFTAFIATFVVMITMIITLVWN